MRIVPFPKPATRRDDDAPRAQLEAALYGDAGGSQAESWRELRDDVRTLAHAHVARSSSRELRERIEQRAAAPRRERRRPRTARDARARSGVARLGPRSAPDRARRRLRDGRRPRAGDRGAVASRPTPVQRPLRMPRREFAAPSSPSALKAQSQTPRSSWHGCGERRRSEVGTPRRSSRPTAAGTPSHRRARAALGPRPTARRHAHARAQARRRAVCRRSGRAAGLARRRLRAELAGAACSAAAAAKPTCS